MAAAIVAVVGEVRSVQDLFKSAAKGGDRWGQRVSVLTDLPGFPGETISVTVFERDRAVDAQPRQRVEWAVGLTWDAKYGLDARFQGVLSAAVEPELVAN